MMDHYLELFEADEPCLEMLSEKRRSRNTNSFDEGPYHYEWYPETLYEPENILLMG